MEDGEKYRGPKTLEAMQEFILSKTLVNVKSIKAEQWDELKSQQWVLFLCGNDNNANCPEMDTIKKVAATLVCFKNVCVVKADFFSYSGGFATSWYSTRRETVQRHFKHIH